MIAPVTGNYSFWIAGDNATELYFNAAGNPTAATRIAYRTTSVPYQDWSSSPTQKSAVFPLVAGQTCYLEARHKEDLYLDNVSVAWEINDTSTAGVLIPREVIPGRYLAPHRLNYTPKVPTMAATVLRNAYQGASVAKVAAVDLNADDAHTWAITAGNAAGIFGIDPATGRVFVANPPALAATGTSSISLSVTALDNGAPPLGGSGVVTVNISNANILSIPSGDRVVWAGGTHNYNSGLIEGTLHLRGDATLGMSGSWINRGVLDLIHWNGTLPAGLSNEGVILDRSSVKVLSSFRTGTSFELTTPGYAGHGYQLKTSEALSGPWVDSGAPVPGTGTPAAPEILFFAAPAVETRRFYKVELTPAP
jgi:hypothetical protein